MASPDALADFAGRLTGLANIYPRPTTAQLSLPAIVMRPDEPWIEPGGYGWDDENILAVCVVGTGDAEESSRALQDLAAEVVAVISGDYEFKSVSEPFLYKEQGIDYLAIRVGIRFRRLWASLVGSGAS